MAEATPFWEHLLDDTGSRRQTLTWRLVRKQGRPFLLLPLKPDLARQTLALYPAQTPRARATRFALGLALRLNLPVGGKVSAPVSPLHPLCRFLTEAAGGKDDSVPGFGLLAGNPNAPGRRFIFLVFNPQGKAASVVKVGTTSAAKELIRREKVFLRNAPPQLAGIPCLRATLESAEAEALAMDFIDGTSPDETRESQIPRLLTSWLHSDRTVLISETRVWKEIETAGAENPLFQKLSAKIRNHSVHPAVFHGDFAPWNIRVSSVGSWTVFDWERGDLNGLPGYDWFHYLIQTRILVAHEPVSALISRLGKLIDSPEFQQYAKLAHLSGVEREIALLYLLHHNEVIRPGEGLPEGRALLEALAAM